MIVVYAIMVNDHLSQEGYMYINDAIAFIRSRKDGPQKVDNWLWKSKSNIYKILRLEIK